MEENETHGTDHHVNYIQGPTRLGNDWYNVLRFLWKINYNACKVEDLRKPVVTLKRY